MANFITKRFQLIPGEHKPRLKRNGVIFLGLVFLVLALAYSQGGIIPLPKGGYTIQADFRTSANVSPGKTPVRVDGVTIGEVEKLERSGDHVRVTMRIDDSKTDGLKIRSDARADIYWRTLLGFAFYIQLEPGSAPDELGDGVIPVERTTSQVEADQLLGEIDAPSRKGIQETFGSFSEGFDGDDAGDTVDALAPSFKQVTPALQGIQGIERGDLSQTIRHTSDLVEGLVRSERELATLFPNADGTLSVTNARRADIAATLQTAPTAMLETQTTMRRLRTTFDILDPISQDLRPGVRRLDDAAEDLRPALDEVRPTLRAARPLLRDLNPALDALGRAGDRGVPALRRLEPTLERLNGEIIPWLNSTDNFIGNKVYEMIGPVFATVGASAGNFDASGHAQRFQALAGGFDSAGFLPCTFDEQTFGVNCADVEKIINQALFGAPPAAKAKEAGNR